MNNQEEQGCGCVSGPVIVLVIVCCALWAVFSPAKTDNQLCYLGQEFCK